MPPITPTATLTVTNQTTAKELRDFVDQAENNDQVFGTVVKGTDGGPKATVLYLAKKPDDSGELKHDQFHKNVKDARRETAGKALKTILNLAMANKTSDDATDHAPERKFRADVKSMMSAFFRGKLAVAPPAPQPTAEPTGTQTVTQLMAKFNKQSPAALGVKVATVNDLLDTTDQAAAHVDRIRTDIQQTDQSLPKLPEPGATLVSGTSVPINGREYPKIMMGPQRTVMVPKEVVGQGAYGVVVLYKEDNAGTQEGGGLEKMVKFPLFVNKEVGETFKENGGNDTLTIEKIDYHNRAAGHERVAGENFGRLENVMGCTDHMILENGAMALISEVGTHGNVHDLGIRLKAAKDSNSITEHTRRLVALTITDDLATGVASIHKAKGIHNDMKTLNQVINKDAKAGLIDLAFTRKGPGISGLANQQHLGTVPEYNSPEALILENDSKANRATVEGSYKKNEKEIRQEFSELVRKVSGEEDQVVNAHDTLFTDAAQSELEGNFSYGPKADVYGVGISAYYLATGKLPVAARREQAHMELLENQGFPIPVSKPDIIQVAKDNKDAAGRAEESHGINFGDGSAQENNALLEPTGDPVLDVLFDDLLAPNPEKRIASKGIHDHISMKYAARDGKRAVGSPEVRALILAISEPDDDNGNVVAAQAALLAAFPEPTEMSSVFDAEVEERGAKADKERAVAAEAFDTMLQSPLQVQELDEMAPYTGGGLSEMNELLDPVSGGQDLKGGRADSFVGSVGSEKKSDNGFGDT